MPLPNVDNAQFIAYHGIGNGAPTLENPRGINMLAPYDFFALAAGVMQDYYDAGFRRIMLWQPFGLDFIYDEIEEEFVGDDWGSIDTYGTIIDLSTIFQRLDHWLTCTQGASASIYGTLTSTFVPAVRQFIAEHPGVEIIAYTGFAKNCPDFDALDAAGKEARFWASMEPFIEAGCSVAFDASVNYQLTDWTWPLLVDLEQSGTRVYLESAPLYQATHQYGSNWICDTSQFRVVVVNDAAGGEVFMSPSVGTGERMMLLVGWPAVFPTKAPPDNLLPQNQLAAYYKHQILSHLARTDADSVCVTADVLLIPAYGGDPDFTLDDLGRTAKSGDANHNLVASDA